MCSCPHILYRPLIFWRDHLSSDTFYMYISFLQSFCSSIHLIRCSFLISGTPTLFVPYFALSWLVYFIRRAHFLFMLFIICIKRLSNESSSLQFHKSFEKHKKFWDFSKSLKTQKLLKFKKVMYKLPNKAKTFISLVLITLIKNYFFRVEIFFHKFSHN